MMRSSDTVKVRVLFQIPVFQIYLTLRYFKLSSNHLALPPNAKLASSKAKVF